MSQSLNTIISCEYLSGTEFLKIQYVTFLHENVSKWLCILLSFQLCSNPKKSVIFFSKVLVGFSSTSQRVTEWGKVNRTYLVHKRHVKQQWRLFNSEDSHASSLCHQTVHALWCIRWNVPRRVLVELGRRLMGLYVLSQVANWDDRLREWMWQELKNKLGERHLWSPVGGLWHI